jgi:hypothetical protein
MDYFESGMDFSPLFSDNRSVYIEKTQFLNRLGEGIKTVEILTLMPNHKLYFIEAKSSAPNPHSKANFSEYCDKLLEKFQHSLDLFISKELGVNKDWENEFPDCFDKNPFSEYRIIFVLIINGHKKEWCSDVLDGLQRKLIALRNIWKIDVIVWNDETARKKKFIN